MSPAYVRAATTTVHERLPSGGLGKVLSTRKGWALLCDHPLHPGWTTDGFVTRGEALTARDEHDAAYHPQREWPE